MNIDILVSEDIIIENIHHIFGLQCLLELLECKTGRVPKIITHADFLSPNTIYITIGIPKNLLKSIILEKYHLFYGFVGRHYLVELFSSDAIGIFPFGRVNSESNMVYINKKFITPPLDFIVQPEFRYPISEKYILFSKKTKESMFEFIIDVILEYSRKKDEPTT